jgi:ribonuclease P protein component
MFVFMISVPYIKGQFFHRQENRIAIKSNPVFCSPNIFWSDHEADVSTEQSEEEEQARLSRADEVERWPQGPGAPPGEGASQAHRQRRAITSERTLRHTLKKSEILRGRSKFQDIFKRGRPVDGKFIRCLVLRERPVREPGLLVVGVAVARAVRRAVDRNRIKRLLRESYRANKQHLPADAALTLLFLWRSAKLSTMPSLNEIANDMKSILLRIRDGAPS